MAEPARQFWPRAVSRARAAVPVEVDLRGGGDERENLTLSPPRSTPTPRRRLRLSERLLAVWLREQLGTVGAVAMVRRYGPRAVLDALYDGVVCEEPLYRTGATGRVEVSRRLVPAAGLRNPGGFLRFLLEERR